MALQLGIPAAGLAFTVNISKIYVYAIKLGDPRDVPRIAVSFRDPTRPTSQPLVVEDRGTLDRPARVAARLPPFTAQAVEGSTDLVLAFQGNGAAAPKALAITVYFFLRWRISALVPPNMTEAPLLRDVSGGFEDDDDEDDSEPED